MPCVVRVRAYVRACVRTCGSVGGWDSVFVHACVCNILLGSMKLKYYVNYL